MHDLRLCLYQPDIPQNAGTLFRMGACLDIGVDIVEPCGFLLDDRRMRRAGMDYLDSVRWARHPSFAAFDASRRAQGRRLVLLTTRAEERLDRFTFHPDDVIMVGRESAGVPDEVARAADARIRIPMAPGLRSLNVALAAALAAGAALSQLAAWPGEESP